MKLIDKDACGVLLWELLIYYLIGFLASTCPKVNMGLIPNETEKKTLKYPRKMFWLPKYLEIH